VQRCREEVETPSPFLDGPLADWRVGPPGCGPADCVFSRDNLITTQRYMHLSPAALDGAIRLLECSGICRSCGDILESVP
jgi:hypothetical protein